MLITYCLTVRLLARQQQSLCGGGGGGIGSGGANTTGVSTTGAVSTTNGNQPNGWGSGWLGQQTNLGELLSYCFFPKTLFNHSFNPFWRTRENKMKYRKKKYERCT